MDRIKKIRKKQKENQGKKLIKTVISSKIKEYIMMLQNNIKNKKFQQKNMSTDEIKYYADELHKEMKVALDCLLGINNSIIIKNGINIRKFQNVSEGKQEIRQTLDILPEQFVVGHVGRFSEVKNHEFILDVFNQILKYKDAHLILIGNGVLLPVIKFKIKRLGLEKQVTILTHRSDINRLLKAMDVFFFPSLFEGFGIALLEAQAAGLRCVISDTIPDVVRVLDSTVAVSLSMPAEYWCNIIIDDSITQPHTATLEEYDIVPIVKQLQKMSDNTFPITE